MPYVTHKSRGYIEDGLEPIIAGELNYKVTRVIDKWLGSTPNYDTLNAAIGVLECAKLELYRRVCAPYEDSKINANGDVYQLRIFE